MQIPADARQRIWKAILELRNPSSGLSGAPSLIKNSSTASTASVRSQCSYSGQPTPLYHATRFTLKQTLSFKVKEEDENTNVNGGDELDQMDDYPLEDLWSSYDTQNDLWTLT